MKYILTLILLLIPTTLCADGVEDLRKAIDYETQKVRYIPPISDGKTSADRGRTLRLLSKFDKPVGFRPVISILPSGVGLPVWGVSVSADRRYVRIGLGPSFSVIGNVDTFNFGR